MKKVFITGISGTGKTTIAKELEKRGVSTIDVDYVEGLCSWFNIETQEKVIGLNSGDVNNDFIDRHEYRCDLDRLKELMDENEDIVVVFGVVGENEDLLPLFDKVILLQCSDENIVNRLNSRDGNDFGKTPEVQERMLDWRKRFDRLMIEAGAVVVNTDRSIEKTAEDILDQM